MWESGRALIAKYPHVFGEADQEKSIEDLLRRFFNRALGDTVFRVGRDLRRKLGPNDRFIAAMRASTGGTFSSNREATSGGSRLHERIVRPP